MRRSWSGGFTIVEVIVVLTIILVLAGLVLGTTGYVHKKAARSRAEAEIQAISAALENYKAENGVYPSLPAGSTPPSASDSLDATAPPNFTNYQSASAILYQGLTGDTDGDGQPETGLKSYMALKSNQLGGSAGTTFVRDPFGDSYGYSTAGQAANGGTQSIGYNPTFDLWSTAGSSIPAGWVKNW